MNEKPYFLVVDRHHRVLWYGQAESAADAALKARADPLDDDWPEQPPRNLPDEVEVYFVPSDIKPGPRALRSALNQGLSLGTFAI